MVQIIKLRAATEGLTVDETAIQVLGQIGTRFLWKNNTGDDIISIGESSFMIEFSAQPFDMLCSFLLLRRFR